MIANTVTTENIVPETTAYIYTASDELKTSNKILRQITMLLQVIAMLAYYMPTLTTGGNIGIFWLIQGVLQTIIFSAIFFRNSYSRVGLSITLMVIGTLINLVMIIMVGFFALVVIMMGINMTAALTYIFCSTLAVIFALCFPRKYIMIAQPAPQLTYTQPVPQTTAQPAPQPQPVKEDI